MPRVSRLIFLSALHRLRWLRLTKFVRRSLRLAFKKQSRISKEAALAPEAESRLGYYLLHGNRYQKGELVILPARAALANVFLDVLGEMGGQVVVVMGEDLGKEQPLLSISPPVAAPWLQSLLSDYEDVLKQDHRVELSVQSVEKCCSAVLTPDKHILMRVCDPTRYVRALESRGLREVEQIPAAPHRQHAPRALASRVDEVRLDELKQYLSVNSSTFSPQQEWLH